MKDYAARIARLRARKLEQTQEKIRVEGTLDEDDYGRIVPPRGCGTSVRTIPTGRSTAMTPGPTTSAA